MKKPDASFLLKEKIQQKQNELVLETELLKQEFALAKEGLNPINLIKGALTSSETKTTLTDTLIGIATGYLARKVIVRTSHNPVLKFLGTIAGMGVGNMIAKHPEGIKTIGEKIFKMIFKKHTDNYADEKVNG